MYEKKRILLIEDNHLDAELLMLELDQLNTDYSVLHVQSIRQAAQQIANEKFDLLLLDLGLPDGSGVGSYDKLSELPLKCLGSYCPEWMMKKLP